MAKTFSLIVAAPGAEPIHYRLSRELVVLGRGEACHVSLDAKAVSSRHCEFRKGESGGYRVIDLGSTNGTRVNGQRVMSSSGISLKSGDRLLFGETVEAHFFEAIDAELTQGTVSAMPEEEGETRPDWLGLPVWLDATDEPYEDDEINPVAAAVARQQGVSSSR